MAEASGGKRKNYYIPTPPKAKNYRSRYYIIILILLIGALCLIWRLVDLTVIKRAFLLGQGDARTLRTVIIPSYRGMILDRNGEPLAISTPVDSIWVNPKEFTGSPSDIQRLASLLNVSARDIKTRINLAGDREFVYLKRGVDPSLANIVKALKVPGVYLQPEFKRFYPEGEVTAHVLGFTNIDDQGQEGLELAFNHWLQGVVGLKQVLKDRLGNTVADVSVIKAPRAGQNLVLSIDHRIQYFAYRELLAGVEKNKAKSGSIVVLDVSNGEILAMVNLPSYNPNNRPSNQDGRYRNRAVTDLFEPGSTIKPFSMASALASGKYHVDSMINTSPGWMMVDGKRIRDEHNNGVIDLTDILKVSSNMGMSKITLSLPSQNLWRMLYGVGFGQITQSGFPGERTGDLANYKTWGPFVLATVSFGYSISVTALQLAQAYAVLANEGIKYPVTFLHQTQAPVAERVMDAKVAADILTMMESVLTKGGTAPLARVPGYRVTGKTGTAHMVGPGGYLKNHYNSIFVGIAPASHPRLVAVVILHDPQGGQYYGGYVSGPIFSHVMGEALRLMNIAPDDLSSLSATPVVVTPPPPGMAD